MSLNIYKSKRTFKSTPEPKNTKRTKLTGSLPIFCIQKHAASHLHYDFRLECRGVMLSWAIPKGPSLDPSQKRLAVHVEDHPIEYCNFEGIIPAGNYGAGSVMIWDEGFYTVPGASTKREIEKAVEEGFEKGHIEIELAGQKLRGGFVLQQLRKNDDKSWLFIKRKDNEANTKHEVTDQDRSVRTDRTIAEIGGKKKALKNIKAPKKKMPGFIKPMLATLVKEPFDSDEWLFEIKWDGYRALAYLDKKVALFSRNEKTFNQLFNSIVEDLSKLKAQAIMDGEVVVLDKEGKSDFQQMQNYQKTLHGSLYYYVFDLLYLNGQDLRELPLTERKQILKALIEGSSLSRTRYSDHIIGKGKAFFHAAAKKHLEGIMAKKMDSIYVSKRSRDWLKIKTSMRQETVIGGFTQPHGKRKHFGALLLGVYDDQKKFAYIGHVGTGFDTKLLESLYKKMQPLITSKCPFKNIPKSHAPAIWLKPSLVAEVSFEEWTKDGILRQPVFQGLRMDKKAITVKKEESLAIKPSKEPATKKKKETEEVQFTNQDKIFWPKLKLTKGDLIHYYEEATNFILPYLKNHPLMLKRYPNGVTDPGFIQKDTKTMHLPSWIKTVNIEHEAKTIAYFLIEDKKALEFLANLGTIEIHPFLSQIQKPEYPNYFVIDLDPEAVEFAQVIETAQHVHDILEYLKIPSVCKTSGKRGMHICIPMGQKYTFDEVLKFGQIIAQYINNEIPEITSLIRQPSKRQKKVYLDVLQNHYKQTVIAPYSARGTPEATVSAPLKWSEVKKGLDPTDFTITTMPKRMKKVGDLFAPAIGKGIDIYAALKKLQRKLSVAK
jgi:bifunctional non-homologous end joining protein LigD